VEALFVLSAASLLSGSGAIALWASDDFEGGSKFTVSGIDGPDATEEVRGVAR